MNIIQHIVHIAGDTQQVLTIVEIQSFAIGKRVQKFLFALRISSLQNSPNLESGQGWF